MDAQKVSTDTNKRLARILVILCVVAALAVASAVFVFVQKAGEPNTVITPTFASVGVEGNDAPRQIPSLAIDYPDGWEAEIDAGEHSVDVTFTHPSGWKVPVSIYDKRISGGGAFGEVSLDVLADSAMPTINNGDGSGKIAVLEAATDYGTTVLLTYFDPKFDGAGDLFFVGNDAKIAAHAYGPNDEYFLAEEDLASPLLQEAVFILSSVRLA